MLTKSDLLYTLRVGGIIFCVILVLGSLGSVYYYDKHFMSDAWLIGRVSFFIKTAFKTFLLSISSSVIFLVIYRKIRS